MLLRLFPARSALLPGIVLALPLAGHAAGVADTALQLGEITVTAQRMGALQAGNVLGSVDILGAARLQDANVSQAWQLFSKVPGVMLTQFNQGNVSGKFSFRGFNGEGEINAIKLLIDGVPSNSNDGNMPYLDMLQTMEIAAIEVVRGTNDPRHGLHNIAGNADVQTWTGGDYLRGRLTYGSFETLDVQAVAGIDGKLLAQNYTAAYQRSSGHRDHSGSEKASLAGKWTFTLEGGHSLGLSLRHTDLESEEAGYLTQAEAKANPAQSPAHNASDGGHRLLTQAALRASIGLGEALSWNSLAYVNDLSDRRFVRFSAGVSQQERYTDERHHGASSTLTWRAGATRLGEFTLEGGVDAQWQDNVSQRYSTALRARTAQTRDQQFDFDIHGVYLQAVLQPVSGLKLVPAWRVDQVEGSYLNRRNGLRYAINDYGTVSQPKFSAIYAPGGRLSYYANWGRSFQVGVGTASYAVNQTSALEPSINDGWELGSKFRVGSRVEGRLTLWQQTASNEARRKLNDPANDAENIGRTRRNGLDLQVNAEPVDGTSLWAALSWQDSKILKAESSLPLSQGKEIDHVPQRLYSAGIEHRVTPQLTLTGQLTGQSAYYLERTNSTARYGSFTTLDLGARWQASALLQVQAQLKNAFDQYHEYVWWDGAQSLHAPGSGRSVHLGLKWEH
jgi:iron complex outermembrane recepter protein